MKQRRLTKAEVRRLAEYNVQRKKLGLPPVSTLLTPKRDLSKIGTTPRPTLSWVPRTGAVATASVPSHVSEEPATNATARRSIMEHVLHGNEAPEVAAEIIRKSKCMAPAYNKGAYQYVGDAETAMYAGRKVK